MRRTMMHAKIHRATVTGANIDYVGSITLDPGLLDRAGILPHEQVHVLDLDNGARFETYAIPGTRGSGEVVINGAAARLVNPGEKVIVIAYGSFEEAEARKLVPRVVLVDESNRAVESRTNSAAGSALT
jgi:aspartate 1-decarboxylase